MKRYVLPCRTVKVLVKNVTRVGDLILIHRVAQMGRVRAGSTVTAVKMAQITFQELVQILFTLNKSRALVSVEALTRESVQAVPTANLQLCLVQVRASTAQPTLQAQEILEMSLA